jgi:hypothetical protein
VDTDRNCTDEQTGHHVLFFAQLTMACVTPSPSHHLLSAQSCPISSPRRQCRVAWVPRDEAESNRLSQGKSDSAHGQRVAMGRSAETAAPCPCIFPG